MTWKLKKHPLYTSDNGDQLLNRRNDRKTDQQFIQVFLCYTCDDVLGVYYCAYLIHETNIPVADNRYLNRKVKVIPIILEGKRASSGFKSPSKQGTAQAEKENSLAQSSQRTLDLIPRVTSEETFPDFNNITMVNENQACQQIRNAIHRHHIKDFIKPENETCVRRFPICIVIGVAKCGTRELVDFLNLHPHIVTSPSTSKSYEMPYFSKNYSKGDNWFKNQMPCSYSNQIIIMKSVGYFHNRYVPERINLFNSSIKLIFMIREPISRAISHFMLRQHQQEVKIKGVITNYALHNFSSFVFNANNSQLVVERNAFVRHSVYDEPMLRWLSYFDLSQFLIIENEEFKHNPVEVLTKVEQFLGLEHYISADKFVFNNEKGFYCIRTNLTATGMVCYSDHRGKRKQIMVPQSMIAKLKEYFYPKNKRFFEIIEKSFDWQYKN